MCGCVSQPVRAHFVQEMFRLKLFPSFSPLLKSGPCLCRRTRTGGVDLSGPGQLR